MRNYIRFMSSYCHVKGLLAGINIAIVVLEFTTNLELGQQRTVIGTTWSAFYENIAKYTFLPNIWCGRLSVQSPDPWLIFYYSNDLNHYSYICSDNYVFSHIISLDIDECLSSPCSLPSSCINKIGSYKCTCGKGYTLDGESCIGM